MQARKLTKILNNTRYTVNDKKDKICVGSPMCSDLISVDKATFKLRYALDTFNEGRKCIETRNEELLFIWDKLQELIDNGEIKDIIEKNDILENPLSVFTIKKGKLIETFTDAFGYPNTTITGEIMYDNTFFENKQDAIKHGISEYKYGIKYSKERVKQKKGELKEAKKRLKYEIDSFNYLTSLLN